MRYITLGETVDFKFSTRKFSTGAPHTLTSGALRAYHYDSLSQTSAGITLTADFDTVTGLNHVQVVATAGNGFVAPAYVAFVLTAGTVDGVSVAGEVVAEMMIGPAPAHVVSVAADAITASALAADAVTEIQAGLATSAALATVQADTDNLQTRLPAALVGGKMDSVATLGADAITAATLSADAIAEIQAGLATGVNLALVLTDTAAILLDTAAILDATTDPIAEFAVGVPPATPTPRQAAMWLYMALRNRVEVDSAGLEKRFHDSAGAVIAKKPITTTATEYAESVTVAGP